MCSISIVLFICFSCHFFLSFSSLHPPSSPVTMGDIVSAFAASDGIVTANDMNETTTPIGENTTIDGPWDLLQKGLFVAFVHPNVKFGNWSRVAQEAQTMLNDPHTPLVDLPMQVEETGEPVLVEEADGTRSVIIAQQTISGMEDECVCLGMRTFAMFQRNLLAAQRGEKGEKREVQEGVPVKDAREDVPVYFRLVGTTVYKGDISSLILPPACQLYVKAADVAELGKKTVMG